jgi:hypothetical protein
MRVINTKPAIVAALKARITKQYKKGLHPREKKKLACPVCFWQTMAGNLRRHIISKHPDQKTSTLADLRQNLKESYGI